MTAVEDSEGKSRKSTPDSEEIEFARKIERYYIRKIENYSRDDVERTLRNAGIKRGCLKRNLGPFDRARALVFFRQWIDENQIDREKLDERMDWIMEYLRPAE